MSSKVWVEGFDEIVMLFDNYRAANKHLDSLADELNSICIRETQNFSPDRSMLKSGMVEHSPMPVKPSFSIIKKEEGLCNKTPREVPAGNLNWRLRVVYLAFIVY